MDGINLNEDQKSLKEAIDVDLQRARDLLSRKPNIGDDISKIIADMGQKAYRLHAELKKTGINVKHHKYMIENREKTPDHPEFYMHIHPVEDLLKFIKDPHANDDPEDITIGEEFTFRVFSRRRDSFDNYVLRRTSTGWQLKNIHVGFARGVCDKKGSPHLYDSLHRDSIRYPADLGRYLEWIWDRAHEEGLSREQVQSALDELAEWLKAVEKQRPASEFWSGA